MTQPGEQLLSPVLFVFSNCAFYPVIHRPFSRKPSLACVWVSGLGTREERQGHPGNQESCLRG